MINRKIVNKIITISVKILFSVLFITFFFTYIHFEATKRPQSEIDEILNAQKEGMRMVISGESTTNGKHNKNVTYWPPKMNQPYPDLELLDRDGRVFKLSDLKGYILVVSYIDMSSPVSQAQAGAAVTGAYGTTREIDKNTEPFSEAVHKNATDNFTLPNDGVLEVDILVYTPNGAQATLNDADQWAKHFDLNLSRGVIVAVPKDDLRGTDVQEILTGYQLVDRHMMLRVDSAGPIPKHNLKMTLIPLLSKLAQ